MSAEKRILFICGSMNQTTQMHQISRHLTEYQQAFTPFYCDGVLEAMRRLKRLEFTIIGAKLAQRCHHYLNASELAIDYQGRRGPYDLVVTCSDVIVQKNIRGNRIVLVQEGITDPETSAFRLVQRHRSLPLWIAGTAATGLSRRLPRLLRGQRRIPRPVHRKGREGGEDRRHRHPELRQLRALSRQLVSAPALRPRLHVAAARDLPRRGSALVHPQCRRRRQRPPDDLQVPPQRGPGAGREGSAAVRPGRPGRSGTAARKR